MEHMVAIQLACQLGIKSTTHLHEHIWTPAEIRDVCKTTNNNLEFLWDNVWDQRFLMTSKLIELIMILLRAGRPCPA